MRKRVALAQTFINSPEILLMDEPFSALDMQTRTLMQDELLQLWSGTGGSVVFVTHDLEEAIALADRVFVLSARPGHAQARLRDRPAASARHVRGALRPALHRAIQAHLGRPARRSRDPLIHPRCLLKQRDFP